jgi:hypothetical protein
LQPNIAQITNLLVIGKQKKALHASGPGAMGTRNPRVKNLLGCMDIFYPHGFANGVFPHPSGETDVDASYRIPDPLPDGTLIYSMTYGPASKPLYFVRSGCYVAVLMPWWCLNLIDAWMLHDNSDDICLFMKL